MHKKTKIYLAIFAIILPIGGFFIFSQNSFSKEAIPAAQAVDNVLTEAQTVQTIEDAAVGTLAVAEEKLGSTSPAADVVETAEKTVAAPVEVEKAATKVSCDYPSQILSLKDWKETLPTGKSGKPTEIKQASLISYVSNQFFHPNSACDGVVFRAPVNGVTTSGSGYPRSELREMTGGGNGLASWSASSGTHSMFIDQAITAVPKVKKHVVAGQIHDSEDDVIVIRLEYPKLFVDINGKQGPVLDPNYTLGKRFTVKFTASGGQISVFYNGSTTPSYTMKKSGSGNYFKAGAYTQSNCSKEKDCSDNNFGEVVIHKLVLQH